MTELEESRRIVQAKIQILQRQLPRKLCIKEKNLLKNFNKNPCSPIAKLKKLYTFMDEIYQFVNKFTPCKSGCSACCQIEVSISGLEIEYIEQSTGIKRSSEVQIPIGQAQPCPLLSSNGSCNVYKVRPFMCRRHITFDNSAKWCQMAICHDIDLPRPEFSEVLKTYRQIVIESGLAEWRDIRSMFRGNI